MRVSCFSTYGVQTESGPGVFPDAFRRHVKMVRMNAHTLSSDICGVPCSHYHAAMTQQEREEVQANWTHDRMQIIVATIAFGMGESCACHCMQPLTSLHPSCLLQPLPPFPWLLQRGSDLLLLWPFECAFMLCHQDAERILHERKCKCVCRHQQARCALCHALLRPQISGGLSPGKAMTPSGN